MSFDPITVAIANEYTDEKIGGSSGGAGGEVINLAEYSAEVSGSEMNINLAILMLAANGGGTHTYETGMAQFWADVIARQPDYLVFDLGYGTAGRVSIGALIASADTLENGDSMVSAIGILSMYGMSLEGNFVLTQYETDGLKISVKADPVEFPDNALEM